MKLNRTVANGDHNNQVDSGVPAETVKNDGPVMKLHISLFDIGHERAVNSGAFKAREADVDSLRRHAEAMARETRREVFNPDQHPEHQLRDDEHKKVLADRLDAEDGVKFSAADVRQRDQVLARLPNHARPTAHVLMAVLVLGIAATVTPTVHDFLFAMIEDEAMSWLFSFITAGVVAAVIVWAILGAVGATGRRSVTNWLGLSAGVLISVGLGLFRFSGATGFEEVVVAVGLTALEVGMVVIAEWVASGLRDHSNEWTAEQSVRLQAEAALNAATAEHERRLAQLHRLNDNVRDHVAYVEDCSRRNIHLDELVETATKAIIDGYHDGLAVNRGQVVKSGGAK